MMTAATGNGGRLSACLFLLFVAGSCSSSELLWDSGSSVGETTRERVNVKNAVFINIPIFHMVTKYYYKTTEKNNKKNCGWQPFCHEFLLGIFSLVTVQCFVILLHSWETFHLLTQFCEGNNLRWQNLLKIVKISQEKSILLLENANVL